jgi:hypothetical protein
VQRRLERCKRDPALAGLRGERKVAALPPDDRRACQRLWSDVDALLAKAGGSEKK